MISEKHLLKICNELGLKMLKSCQQPRFGIKNNKIKHYSYDIVLEHNFLSGGVASICTIEDFYTIRLFGKTYFLKLDFPAKIKKFDEDKYIITDWGECYLSVLAPILTKRYLNYYKLKLEYLITKNKRKQIKTRLCDMEDDFK